MLEALLTTKPVGASNDGYPGEGLLIAGDDTLGWKGTLLSTQFINGSALASLCGLTAGTLVFNTIAWMKFQINGKPAYVPLKAIRHSVTWAQLHAKELVFGKVVTILGRQYTVRLMTGATSDPIGASGGEWNDLMYPIHVDHPNSAAVWANYTDADLGITATIAGANWCQEAINSAGLYHVYRGYGGVTRFVNDVAGSQYINYGWRPILIPV